MITKHIYDKPGGTFLRTEQADPVCNKDFCDKCGDCLYCYWEDPCPRGDNTSHFWAAYEDEIAERLDR